MMETLGDKLKEQAALVEALGGKKAGWYISADWPRLSAYIKALETYHALKRTCRPAELWFLFGFWAGVVTLALSDWAFS